MAEKLPQKENEFILKKTIESVLLEYPLYLKSAEGKILGVSKGMPPIRKALENAFRGGVYRSKPFIITDSTGKNWISIEREIMDGIYRVGTIVAEKRIDDYFRRLIINFVLYNENPIFDRFILNKKGKFLANESNIFPGRILSEKDQKIKADNLVKTFLESINEPTGKIVHFSWKIPDLQPERIQIKKVFVKYYPDLEWVVGIGVDIKELKDYKGIELSDLRKRFRSGMVGYFAFIAVLFFFLALAGVYFGRKTHYGFILFKGFFQRANTSYETIDCSQLPFYEFKDLGKIANEMVQDLKDKQRIISDYIKKLNTVNRQLKEMSDRDGLTGIHNRRYFDEALKKSWQNAIRYKQPISIGMIDIDYFKQYNDTYGHQQGDKCLTAVAEIIDSALKRPYDLVARYGGEEFVVMFPDTDTEGAKSLAWIIKENLSVKNLEHKSSDVTRRVTISIGIATIVPGRADLPQTILKKADDALYKAKKEGRNQIIVSS